MINIINIISTAPDINIIIIALPAAQAGSKHKLLLRHRYAAIHHCGRRSLQHAAVAPPVLLAAAADTTIYAIAAAQLPSPPPHCCSTTSSPPSTHRYIAAAACNPFAAHYCPRSPARRTYGAQRTGTATSQQQQQQPTPSHRHQHQHHQHHHHHQAPLPPLHRRSARAHARIAHYYSIIAHLTHCTAHCIVELCHNAHCHRTISPRNRTSNSNKHCTTHAQLQQLLQLLVAAIYIN